MFNKPFNFMLALTMCVAAVVTTSCKGNNDPEVPTQQEIETKIIGRWKQTEIQGEKVLTDKSSVLTYQVNGKETVSTAKAYEVVGFVWSNKAPFSYQVKDNKIIETSLSDGVILYAEFTSIGDNWFKKILTKETFPDGRVSEPNRSMVFTKVTADYSEAIIGLWEGVEMTGDETYGDANHRIEYKADGTYTYYDKVEDSWVSRKDDISEYNVDGDWLATRWQHTAGDVTNYEWWDIVEIKDGTMKWSALREKDKTRFTTTFTWKKVN